MAEIKDCIGKNVKISKSSITIKDECGKTRGIVRNIISVYDMQPNKQVDYFHLFKNLGVWGKISTTNCIVKDGKLSVFRNIKSKMFHERYGYFSDYEKEQAEQEEETFKTLQDAGIEVIECIFVQNQ